MNYDNSWLSPQFDQFGKDITRSQPKSWDLLILLKGLTKGLLPQFFFP